jgi:hypothetical protein
LLTISGQGAIIMQQAWHSRLRLSNLGSTSVYALEFCELHHGADNLFEIAQAFVLRFTTQFTGEALNVHV